MFKISCMLNRGRTVRGSRAAPSQSEEGDAPPAAITPVHAEEPRSPEVGSDEELPHHESSGEESEPESSR